MTRTFDTIATLGLLTATAADLLLASSDNSAEIEQIKLKIDQLRDQIKVYEKHIAYLENGPGMGPDGELNIEPPSGESK